MKFLYLLTCLTVVHAQYFSDGWKPGQETPTKAASAPQAEYTPGVTDTTHHGAPPSVPGGFFERMLASGPFADFFSKFGVNITERLEKAAVSPWDERVPLITDDNYESTIVNESMTAEEEKNRVWFLIVTATAAKQNDINKLADDCFDSAFNTTQEIGDLPDVRWGRIDYLNVTGITTKWNIWQAPYIVVLTDRGQTLRFYKAQHLRLKPEAMRKFLEIEAWKETKPWKTMYSPGGDREWVMEYMAYAFTKFYNLVVVVPKWILLAVSGGVASLALNLMHRGSKPQAKPVPAKANKPAAPEGVSNKSNNGASASTTATAQGATSPSKRATKARKNKK